MDMFFTLQKDVQFALVQSDSYHEFTEKCKEIIVDIQKFEKWGDLSHDEACTLSALLMVQMMGVNDAVNSPLARTILAPIFRNDYPEEE